MRKHEPKPVGWFEDEANTAIEIAQEDGSCLLIYNGKKIMVEKDSNVNDLYQEYRRQLKQIYKGKR